MKADRLFTPTTAQARRGCMTAFTVNGRGYRTPERPTVAICS